MLSQGALALHLQLWDKIRAQDTNIKWVIKRSSISIATIKKYKWLEESKRILISNSWKKKIQRLILCFESDKSVLYWPITIMFRTLKKITKPQTYYHFHLWLSFLMPIIGFFLWAQKHSLLFLMFTVSEFCHFEPRKNKNRMVPMKKIITDRSHNLVNFRLNYSQWTNNHTVF